MPVPASERGSAPAAAGPVAPVQPSAAPEEPLAPAPLTPGDPDAQQGAEAEPEPEYPMLSFHARLMTGVELEREHPEGPQMATDETQAEFFLEQLVFEVEVELSKRIDLELGYNLRNQTIRDAYLNYRFDDALQVRAGRFKRPFSRLELRSRGKLPFRDRGLFNDIVLSDGGFAGRTLGAMVWGKLAADRVRYYLAAASPTEIGSGIEGLDLVARVTYEPVPGVSIGANGMHKWSERFADGAEISVNGVGADTRIEIGRFEITLELDAVQNPIPPAVPELTDTERTPWALGFFGYAEYMFKISKKWDIGPVVVFEWLDTDTEYGQDERVRAVGGLSWNYEKNMLRIMPQVEITRPTGSASTRGEVASETFYLLLSAEI